MSTTLLLLRHAKSTWSPDGMADSERPLDKRGKEASRVMGDYIAKHDLLPDVILSSPAVRARETVAGLEERWPNDVPVVFEPALYGATEYELLDCIKAQAGGIQRLLVAGHNPGVESLALSLDRNGPAHLIGEITKKFPTCALAIFSCKEPWGKFSSGNAVLEDFVQPEDLLSGI